MVARGEPDIIWAASDWICWLNHNRVIHVLFERIALILSSLSRLLCSFFSRIMAIRRINVLNRHLLSYQSSFWGLGRHLNLTRSLWEVLLRVFREINRSALSEIYELVLRRHFHDVNLTLTFQDNFWSGDILWGTKGRSTRRSRLKRIFSVEKPKRILLPQSALLTESVLWAGGIRCCTD